MLFLEIDCANQYRIFAEYGRLALGDQYSMILKQDGSVWSTAVVKSGDTSSSRASRRAGKVFVQVIPSGARAVAAGNSFSLVVKKGGMLWATGRNYNGQHGDGTKLKKESHTFVNFPSLYIQK